METNGFRLFNYYFVRFVHQECCDNVGMTNRLASKLSTEFSCLDRFWGSLTTNYKYLTALDCAAPLWIDKSAKQRHLNMPPWMTEARVRTAGRVKRLLSENTAVVKVAFKRCALLKRRAGIFTRSFISTRWNCTLHNLLYRLDRTQR